MKKYFILEAEIASLAIAAPKTSNAYIEKGAALVLGNKLYCMLDGECFTDNNPDNHHFISGRTYTIINYDGHGHNAQVIIYSAGQNEDGDAQYIIEGAQSFSKNEQPKNKEEKVAFNIPIDNKELSFTVVNL